jgi:thiosulfate/3-mercaptopyruvate sulfurtransferase
VRIFVAAASAALSAVLLWAGRDKPAAHPRPELLIEPAALAKRLGDPALRVLDARPAAAYKAGHIPGAVRVDVADWAKRSKADGLDNAQLWSGLIGDLGIDVRTTAVVVDAGDQRDAARVWWLLTYFGLPDVRLLDGGHGAWADAMLPTETAAVDPAPRRFQAQPVPQRRETGRTLAPAAAAKSIFVLDVRSRVEFTGEKASARRGGHIPGACHLEWINVLDKARGNRFRPPGELARLFADAGVPRDKPIAVHCRSGGRAAVMHFALELSGYANVRNYYASWEEWGNDEKLPVEK